jgi:hypothetical protein
MVCDSCSQRGPAAEVEAGKRALPAVAPGAGTPVGIPALALSCRRVPAEATRQSVESCAMRDLSERRKIEQR